MSVFLLLLKETGLKDGEQIYGPIVLGYPKVHPSKSQASTLAELQQKKKDPVINWI